MSENKAGKLHRIFLFNIILGMLVFAISTFFMITGEYESLVMRKHMEGILNMISMGAMLYSVIFWYLTVFVNPLKRISR